MGLPIIDSFNSLNTTIQNIKNYMQTALCVIWNSNWQTLLFVWEEVKDASQMNKILHIMPVGYFGGPQWTTPSKIHALIESPTLTQGSAMRLTLVNGPLASILKMEPCLALSRWGLSSWNVFSESSHHAVRNLKQSHRGAHGREAILDHLVNPSSGKTGLLVSWQCCEK